MPSSAKLGPCRFETCVILQLPCHIGTLLLLQLHLLLLLLLPLLLLLVLLLLLLLLWLLLLQHNEAIAKRVLSL